MAQPTPSRNKPGAAPAKPVKAPAAPQPHPENLHYSKTDLHDDYTRTFAMFMRMLAIGILGALVYFFIMIIYLGAFGHTKTDDYVREFGTRVQYDYKGLRLPEYDDPSTLKPVKEAK